jgi:uncharacterized protein
VSSLPCAQSTEIKTQAVVAHSHFVLKAMSHNSTSSVVSTAQADIVSSITKRSSEHEIATQRRRKVWIDLDNSPHVPFFVPIIRELEKRGFDIVLTARNSYQVCELLNLYHISCRVVGKHWGKHRLLKMLGTVVRALRLIPIMAVEQPDLALAHGSRGQFLCSVVLRIPCLLIYDYEHSNHTGFLHPDWVLSPEYINESRHRSRRNPSLKYPGLKEDVYVPGFLPDPSLKRELGLESEDIVVTVRPPATEAHYHNPESDVLFDATMRLLTQHPATRVILLPRNSKQNTLLREQWHKSIEARKIIIPVRALNGLNLIWFSDLVVSGGGTMNREAAALGVPVYSIFRGKIGAVDRYLAEQGRLALVESVDEVRRRIALVRRNRPTLPDNRERPALRTIVACIVAILESKSPVCVNFCKEDCENRRV